MTIVDDLHARLSAALGPDVPVLRPEQMGEPLAGRKPGQAGGLNAYLVAHPQGYVQIEALTPLTSDGLTGTFWVAIASVHITALDAAALTQQVRRVLCGLPYDPGPYLEVRPSQPEWIQAGVWMCRPTFDALTLDGEPVAQE